MPSPRIYLAVDNCFASKRWTAPCEWARLVREMGIYYIEASADNECDPFFSTPGVLKGWVASVKDAQQRHGVRVANLYSGHGTYVTLGLAHTDRRIRQHMRDDWLKTMLGTAAELGAGLGFFCHAFAQSILESPQAYAQALETLLDDLADLATHAARFGGAPVSLEQMYSPNQVPWTIAGAQELVRQVYARCGQPMYLTLDVGHACAQRRYRKFTQEELVAALENARSGASKEAVWLGPSVCYQLLENAARSKESGAAAIEHIQSLWQEYPYLFASPVDSDPYNWLRTLGCYSPIVHLQQTDGSVSAHWPFTPAYNARGMIEPILVLEALADAYKEPCQEGMPPRCDSIYLTLEVFSGTADLPRDILSRLQQSATYWRQFVPVDGMPLDELVETIPRSL